MIKARKRLIIFLIICLCFVICFGCITGIVMFCCSFKQLGKDFYTLSEVTDINEYGKFDCEEGGINKFIYKEDVIARTDAITRILPSKIEEFFTIKKYSYRTCIEPFFYEAYLEVVIEDEQQYQSYIKQMIEEKESLDFTYDERLSKYVKKDVNVFFYDENFSEYVFIDYILFDQSYNEDGEPIEETISSSRIQKIMFSDESNTIIFLSFEHGNYSFLISPTWLYYLERFDIDPSNYYGGDRLSLYHRV